MADSRKSGRQQGGGAKIKNNEELHKGIDPEKGFIENILKSNAYKTMTNN